MLYKNVVNEHSTHTQRKRTLERVCKNEKCERKEKDRYEKGEDISYGLESLFTNIPTEETFNYIIEQIYVREKLTPICSELIFRRLLIKLPQGVLLNLIANSEIPE